MIIFHLVQISLYKSLVRLAQVPKMMTQEKRFSKNTRRPKSNYCHEVQHEKMGMNEKAKVENSHHK